MTPRNTLVVVTVLFVAVMSNNSQGQTLLEQIEKRLNQLPKPNKAKTEKQPPADELPAPAKKAQGKPGVLGLSGDDQGEANGITVTAVAKKGPAEAAGIQVGDLIISADGLATKELDDLAAITAIKKAGDELRLGLRRKGQAVNVTLKLASAAAGQPEPAPSEDTIPLPPAPTTLGAARTSIGSPGSGSAPTATPGAPSPSSRSSWACSPSSFRRPTS